MHPFRKLYGQEHDFAYRDDAPTLSYFLAAIPRTGSTFLTIKIWEKGLLGAPLEYWNLHDREEDIARYGAGDLTRYWSNIRKRRTSENGVFGAKLFTSDIRSVCDRQPDALRLITADKIIRVRRRDLAQQAISYSRAKQSRVWIAGAPTAAPDAVAYDFEDLVGNVKAIRRQERSWDEIIERTEARAMSVYYEDFERDPDGEIATIADFLDVAGVGPKRIDLPPVLRQRDQRSTEWLERLSADLADRGLTLDEVV